MLAYGCRTTAQRTHGGESEWRQRPGHGSCPSASGPTPLHGCPRGGRRGLRVLGGYVAQIRGKTDARKIRKTFSELASPKPGSTPRGPRETRARLKAPAKIRRGREASGRFSRAARRLPARLFSATPPYGPTRRLFDRERALQRHGRFADGPRRA